MRTGRSRTTIAGLAAIAALAVVACSSEAPTAPDQGGVPIPTLAKSPAANTCYRWGCTISECGYDPATDPRGACCMSYTGSGIGQPKPSCAAPPLPSGCSAGPPPYEFTCSTPVPGYECELVWEQCRVDGCTAAYYCRRQAWPY